MQKARWPIGQRRPSGTGRVGIVGFGFGRFGIRIAGQVLVIRFEATLFGRTNRCFHAKGHHIVP